ncbi:MAG TPA: ABC transporter substrate-binding protein, partial [Pyrinomonadaceae bacterium]|nr:ABC transporter substrate-binding protein [Pyrinomonadaceae bacterium]
MRALFEGLTDYDPQTLAPVAGVAARWDSSADKRVWTFYLRRDARWSNGTPVTAQDFIRSWQRTLRLGERAPHAKLLNNIVGATSTLASPRLSPPTVPASSPTPAQTQTSNTLATQNESTQGQAALAAPTPEAGRANANPAATPAPAFGVEAVDDFTLRVRLQVPDKNFPALVAHPVFRPVPQASSEPTAASDTAAPLAQAQTPADELKPPVVSNGAFHLAKLTRDNVVLERAQNYWNAGAVALERVRFLNLPDTEAALAAYRTGEVDAVTNVSVEPLVVKLLASYKDFRRATYGALTYYEFNTTRPPFDDLRVRAALSLAVDRTRLSADTLDNATEPAEKFLPTTDADKEQSARKDDDASAPVA